MSKIIGIVAETGYGKSMSFVVPPDGIIKKDSYEGLDPSGAVIFNLDKKSLPYEEYVKVFPVWKDKFKDFFEKKVLEPTPDEFIKWLTAIIETKKEVKNIIIDTFSLGMFRYRMSTELQKGFERWTQMNVKFWNLLDKIQEYERKDLFIWILFHTDEGKDREGNIVYKAKVEGNLLDKIPEKIMTNVFFGTKLNDKHIFETQANQTTAKNPPLLFDPIIPNSMKLIEDTLRGIKLYNKN